MKQIPISVLGMSVAFAIFILALAWGIAADDERPAYAALGALPLLAMSAVWTASSLLRRGHVYQWLRPESRPRRWVLYILLAMFGVFVVWFPVWMTWPESVVAKALTFLFVVVFCGGGLTFKWLSGLVD